MNIFINTIAPIIISLFMTYVILRFLASTLSGEKWQPHKTTFSWFNKKYHSLIMELLKRGHLEYATNIEN